MRAGASFDFVIVGGGVAGLRAAIGLAPAGRVLVLTKAEPAESNTGYAQGGIAAAIGDDDSVRELIEWGARFDRAADGRPSLGREAAHSVRRVLHAGDATGREIGRVLWERVSALGAVETIDHALAAEIVVEDGRAAGVRYFDRGGAPQDVRAGATLLATGGAGQVFRDTTNPAVATGDGIALAFHAGARVADLEFVQFHPTALSRPGAPRFLISEALRGEGARLVNQSGEPFMTRYHPDGDLAPRDVVARSIVRESERTGGAVFLTLAHLDAAYVRGRFPTIAAMLKDLGLDLAVDRIPVGPAAHYMMGGVDTDVCGRTSIAGLFAAGEVACTGLHGANRLASNSLLEGLVFGARAAAAMQEPPRAAPMKEDRVMADGSGLMAEGTNGDHLPYAISHQPSAITNVRELMWRCAGLFRDRAGLEEAVAALDALADASHPATVDRARQRNLSTVARLIARAALRRTESRGGHYRLDYPARDDERWCVHVVETAL
ncbi:MAG: L-aspartate oxidase [Acidobacteria bacterium]|nr:MAG: L-aspartate oxidase [Acidobacteriota bacterium]